MFARYLRIATRVIATVAFAIFFRYSGRNPRTYSDIHFGSV